MDFLANISWSDIGMIISTLLGVFYWGLGGLMVVLGVVYFLVTWLWP